MVNLIEVIICTYRPKIRVLRLVLDGLARQTLAADRWKLTIVNNCPADGTVTHLADTEYPDLNITVIPESRTGLINARIAAINATHGDVLVFSDDDTVLAADYLGHSSAIAENGAAPGAFGGRCHGSFCASPAAWTGPLMGHLAVRDYGDEAI